MNFLNETFIKVVDNHTTYSTRQASKQSISTDLTQCLLILKSFLLQWNTFSACSFIKVNINVDTKLISSGISIEELLIEYLVLHSLLINGDMLLHLLICIITLSIVTCDGWGLMTHSLVTWLWFWVPWHSQSHQGLCGDAVSSSPFSTVESLFMWALWYLCQLACIRA